MDQAAMFKLGYGLYVLSAKGEKDNACIINTAMQITTTPNRMVIVVNKMNLTHDLILENKIFNISVLTQKCEFDLFSRFGYQSGKTVDKFQGFPSYERAENGLCYITAGTNAYLSGRVVDTVDCGTHTMFISDVTDAKVLGTDLSVTYDYYQSHIKPKPADTPKKGYRCKICGYIYEGDVLPEDFICPICKHGAADFEKL